MRRRRAAALIGVGVTAGIVLAATLAFTGLGGSGSKPTTEAATTRKQLTPEEKAAKRRKARARARAQAKLEENADRAATRFAELGLPLYCGGGEKNIVALTFDDGPGPFTMHGLLRVLGNRHARATFFILGRHIQNYPEALQKELKFGAIGNHTWNHASLPGLNRFAVKAQLGDTQRELQRFTGRPVRLFRPPYGAHDVKVDREVRAYGMLQVLWSVDSHDWKGLSPEALIDRILASVRPGSIILMHDIHENTIDALPKLIRSLRRRGYRLLSVPEMLALDPPSMQQLSLGAAGCD